MTTVETAPQTSTEYPPIVFQEYLKANLSYPQTLTGMLALAGSAAVTHVLEGQQTWDDFVAARPSDAQVAESLRYATSTHKAHDLAPTAHMQSPAIYRDLIVRQHRRTIRIILGFAEHELPPDELVAPKLTPMRMDPLAANARILFPPQQARPEAAALEVLWGSVAKQFSPDNPKAVELKRTISRGINRLSELRAAPSQGLRAEIARDLSVVPYRLSELIAKGLREGREPAEEKLGRPLRPDTTYRLGNDMKSPFDILGRLQ